MLWLTTTLIPNTGSPDAGHETAHWVRLSTAAWPPALADQGDIGGEDIHPSGVVYTFFPSLAVNDAGDAYFGFSASSANMYAGAYAAGRKAADAAGTVRASETVHAGEDYYVRTFAPTDPNARNRWGDYSGAALDPGSDNVFWIFNEYAMARGTITSGGEDGRWATAWASFRGETLCGGLGTYTFTSQSNVVIEVTDLGTSNLACLRVEEVAGDHPNATGTSGGSGTSTGRYWVIEALQSDGATAASTGYTLNPKVKTHFL